MTDGVWRTVKGRSVFIKNGQNVRGAIEETLKQEERPAFRGRYYFTKSMWTDSPY